MGIARSTYYDSPEKPVDDTSIVEAMFAICDEFEFYGYRRIGAALRQQGLVVNHKKIRRLMRRERDEQPTVFGVDGIAIALSFRTSALPASA